jgi:hypothetical protein
MSVDITGVPGAGTGRFYVGGPQNSFVIASSTSSDAGFFTKRRVPAQSADVSVLAETRTTGRVARRCASRSTSISSGPVICGIIASSRTRQGAFPHRFKLAECHGTVLRLCDRVARCRKDLGIHLSDFAIVFDEEDGLHAPWSLARDGRIARRRGEAFAHELGEMREKRPSLALDGAGEARIRDREDAVRAQQRARLDGVNQRVPRVGREAELGDDQVGLERVECLHCRVETVGCEDGRAGPVEDEREELAVVVMRIDGEDAEAAQLGARE